MLLSQTQKKQFAGIQSGLRMETQLSLSRPRRLIMGNTKKLIVLFVLKKEKRKIYVTLSP